LKIHAAIGQGLTLLGGSALAQVIPALTAPILTRLYHPADFGIFAFVLAVFGVLAPIACLRYELAIMLEDEAEVANLTLLCIAATFALASLSFVVLGGLCLIAQEPQLRTIMRMLLLMLPLGLLGQGIQLVAQYWSLRAQRYRIQSRAIIMQAMISVVVQTALAAFWGSSTRFLVLGTLAGYAALVAVYRPILQDVVLPVLTRHATLKGAAHAARSYLRFPIYTGPYVMVGQATLRGVFLVLAALTSSAIVGQYALAQRVILLPVFTLMAAVSQIFFSRAAQKLDDPRMQRMVRTALIVGPLCVGPLFMLMFLFGEPLFMDIFGREWQLAGRFAVILSIPSLVRTLTAWLDRVYDIRGRQRLALAVTATYATIAISTMYVTLRVSGNAEFGVTSYAIITSIFYLVWLLFALSVGKFDLRLCGELVVVSLAVAGFMIVGNWIVVSCGIVWPYRLYADILVALPLIGMGIWLGAIQMRRLHPVPPEALPG
jgi:O-antigen/teichoic acid export membrane protein